MSVSPSPVPLSAPLEAQLKVSAHDRVSSMIVALLFLLGFIVFLLFLLWLTNRALVSQPTIPVEYLDELPGGEPSFGVGRDFEEPGLDDIQDLTTPLLEVMLAAVTDIASITRAGSDAMTGAVSRGTSGGDRRRSGHGGNARVPRWERWEVQFTSTRLADYAEQLEWFGIELAAAGGGIDQVDYATGLNKTKPDRRSAPGSGEQRLYMSYRQGQLKAFDRQLLRRAGIAVDGRLLVQFYPPRLEGTLAALERQRAGNRPLADIRKTVFAVKKSGREYSFEVIDQQYR